MENNNAGDTSIVHTIIVISTDYIMFFQDYIHRVGRTARGLRANGHALLFLRPEEFNFLHHLKRAKVVLNEFVFSWDKVIDIQEPVSNLQ